MSSDTKVIIKDAYKGDAGKGRIRIDPQIIKELGLKTADVIKISNSITGKETAALLFPGKDEDKTSNSIRIDSSLRRNLEASVGDIVEIRKIYAIIAERITFAGVKESVVLRRSEQLVRMLENRVITKGDILSFNAMGRKLDFKVYDFSPKADAVRINLNTKITISEKTHKEIIESESKRVTYKDIGGLDKEIQIVRDIVELPLKHPELFKTMNIEPLKNILLYGPPGTGKTLLVRAVAYESGVHFISISGPEIMSKFYGQSEENLRKLFEEAKDMVPSIIFIDQLDSITPNEDDLNSTRERGIIAQLLSLLDGIESRIDIIFIGETSRINKIDVSLRHSGRFDKEIELGAPNVEGRYQILQIKTRGVPLTKDVDLKEIAEKTEGFVGADLYALVKEAALLTMNEILPTIDYEQLIPSKELNSLQIRQEHFLAAIDIVKPRISGKL